MKKITLMLIGIVYSISCYSQRVTLSDTVSIKLPEGAKTLAGNGFSIKVNQEFNFSKLAFKTIPAENRRVDNKHFYKVDDILIRVTRGKGGLKTKTITSLKSKTDWMHLPT